MAPQSYPLQSVLVDWQVRQVRIDMQYRCALISHLGPIPPSSPPPSSPLAACDGLSACSPGAAFQVNFVTPVICVLLSLIIGIASIMLISRQRAAAAKSRAAQVSATPAACSGSSSSSVAPVPPALAAGSDRSMHHPSTSDIALVPDARGLHFALSEATVSVAGGGGAGEALLLDGCSAEYPPGQLSVVLGPSG